MSFFMEKYYTISEASKYVNADPSTLRRWEYEGRIKPLRTAGNQRRYTQAMLDSLYPHNNHNQPQKENKLFAVGYCRVSSAHQKDDLARQKEVVQTYLEKDGQPFEIISDIGSGLNYQKKGLTKLIHLICTKQCNKIVVNYQDRLVRFGFELIEDICKENNVEIVVINQTEDVDDNQELVNDVLSVITVFSAKLYGKRSHKNVKIINTNKDLFAQDD